MENIELGSWPVNMRMWRVGLAAICLNNEAPLYHGHNPTKYAFGTLPVSAPSKEQARFVAEKFVRGFYDEKFVRIDFYNTVEDPRCPAMSSSGPFEGLKQRKDKDKYKSK